ncbi:MAG: argininosuccinate synthase [Planctomycetes bacterium]|nr:argininosuccinate synthase [Planctomycetota bacterium]
MEKVRLARFVSDFILPALKAGARYESGYFLSAALNRPLIAEELVRIADEEACDYVAHGSRGIGNDHIRFNNCIRALNPELKILMPLQELNLKSIRDDILYARKYNIQIESIKETLYNVDSNLWGVNIQLGPGTNLQAEPPRDTYMMTTPLEETPDKSTLIEVGFENGIPVALDGKKMETVDLIELLNNIGGRNAVGRVDMIENKISGEKSREIYEAPAATILHAVYQALAEIRLSKELMQFAPCLSQRYAQVIYNGGWFSPLRQALDRFFDFVATDNGGISGTVKLKLFKGNCIVVGRKISPP